MTAAKATAHYLRSGQKKVSGWLHPFSAKLIAKLAEIQKRNGVTGSVAEIGVHHGKLFILMQTTTYDRMPSVAIDVFGDQHLNTDLSGKGDKDTFLRNLGRWGNGEPVRIIQRSSLEVSPAEFMVQAEHPARMFSVDGGHTAECAENDMRLADAACSSAGIVILDDYFNEFWPGVQDGAHTYCADQSTRMRPFAISPGKVYFCHPDHAAIYVGGLREAFPLEFDKMSVMARHPVAIFGVGLAQWKAFGWLYVLKKRLAAKLRRRKPGAPPGDLLGVEP